MRLLIQRVSKANIKVNKSFVAEINRGLLVFLGVHQDDLGSEIPWLLNKLLNLRIFEDDQGKMNRSVREVDGEVLVVSQFTLYANCEKGRRPDFLASADPSKAQKFYNQFIQDLRAIWPKVESGVFAANMQIELVNDGPVTIILDSKS